MKDEIEFHQEEKEWRGYFARDLIASAEKLVKNGRIISFSCDEREARAELETRPGATFHVRVGPAPQSYYEEWDPDGFSCDCLSRRTVTRGNHTYRVCNHEAAALLEWESRHGPWKFPEPPEVREARVRAEQEKRERAEKARQAQEEQKRLNALKAQEEKITVPAESFFPGEKRDGTFFDLKLAVSKLKTNRYCVNRARDILDKNQAKLNTPVLSYDRDGQQALHAAGTAEDAFGCREVTIVMKRTELETCRCSCAGYYYYDTYSSANRKLCEHKLAVLTLLRDYLLHEDPGDATDRAANDFFLAMDAISSAEEERPAEEAPRPRQVVLRPRLIMNDGELELSYKAGMEGGKQVLLRAYKDFVRAVEERGAFALSKTVTLDFSAVDFTEDSLPWLTFLQRRLSETEAVNDRLSASNYYYTPRGLSVKTRDALTGATLDRFYELAEGSAVEYQGPRKEDALLRVGHARPHVILRSREIADQGKRLLGVEIAGQMPAILKGSAGSYILEGATLSRVTREDEGLLRPFLKAADQTGSILFRVGKNKLAEFYYRILPRLTENPCVQFEDGCAEKVREILPPEPAFTFRLDVDGEYNLVTCEALVAYGEGSTKALPNKGAPGEYRDAAQEERVVNAVLKYFPKYLQGKRLFWAGATEENLYRVLTEGVTELSRYGEAQGSDAFRRSSVRPVPQLRVGVSLESGLMDISVLTKDMSPDELLGVLESYRQKKKFHRLRSGEFLDLAGDRQLADLDELAAGMELSLEELLRNGAEVPAYRALYLDSLLEGHEALAASRDRTYRALVKNFKTIRDADYEVPESLAETLRPYQVYGYKWLRTLAAAGFGGILADEMGLGKTLQAITLMQSLREGGDTGLFLIVCPASLVFNWQEEFQRFAPGMELRVIAGTAAARKKLLQGFPETGAVCVTSYDLLRQDIAAYSALPFSVMVLDEAQYIKNQKAALTKAVKAVPATRRFALTGTPIENRLAELWSIFDFLMPGFLYGYTEFSRRFETPITKQKDPEATDKLKRMTGPFILRRRKSEVLSDLPPKLEEVRYTRFEEEQRKVYDGQVVRMKQLLASSGGSGEDKLRIFAELTRIRQICCDPSLLLEDYHGGSAKRAACLELVRSAIGGGHRMLLFSQFTSMLALLEQDLKAEGIPYFLLTGATPKEQRLRLVREFNEGDTPVFLISLKAGGTGLNLTGADVVIHYDPWWNLAAQNQATDRAHRIGQRSQVTVYRIIVKDSIEEKILALQEAKRDLADAILTGENASLASLSNEELMALLE